MRKLLIIPGLLILMLSTSCSGEKAKARDGIVTEKKMAELLIDTHLADAILFIDNSRADDKRDKALFYYPSVLEKHGITKVQMDSSVAWYMRNPEAYARVYDQVVKELERKRAAEKQKQTDSETTE